MLKTQSKTHSNTNFLGPHSDAVGMKTQTRELDYAQWSGHKYIQSKDCEAAKTTKFVPVFEEFEVNSDLKKTKSKRGKKRLRQTNASNVSHNK